LVGSPYRAIDLYEFPGLEKAILEEMGDIPIFGYGVTAFRLKFLLLRWRYEDRLPSQATW